MFCLKCACSVCVCVCACMYVCIFAHHHQPITVTFSVVTLYRCFHYIRISNSEAHFQFSSLVLFEILSVCHGSLAVSARATVAPGSVFIDIQY